MSETSPLALTEAPGEAGRQFVTFWVAEEIFGVPLGEVQEIIRMPGLVHVPMAPNSLEGIANLRGAVLPITSLRRTFGMQEVAHNDATRVVVLNRGALSGFVVDRMARVINTEADEIEPMNAIGAAVSTDLLQGMVKRDQRMIMLLDPARLGGLEAATEVHRQRREAGMSDGLARERQAGTRADNEVQLVSFEVDGQEYAFPIADVQEIVQVPPHISTVPRSDQHVIGVMTLRNRLLPLVSLRSMFGMPQPPLGETNRIVVVSLGPMASGKQPGSVGIVMDSVKEVLRVSLALVDAVPALLTCNGGAEGLESICRLEDGKRLVTILSAGRMFAGADFSGVAMEPAAQTLGDDAMANETAGPALDEEDEQFVVFRLNKEEYGVPIGAVQEIVRVPDELTRVPRTPAFMEGIINLRGVVLPVVDQRRRFNLPDLARNDRQRIMVLMVGTVRTGFIVDSVAEVLKVARSTIGPAPHLSEQQSLLIDRVANLEGQKRMLLLLQPERLLSAGERDAVAAV